MSEHYFSDTPESEFTPRTIRAELAGKNVTLTTAGGTFSPEHVDRGTRALLNNAPLPPSTGTLLDLGCGWGPIALSLALWSPEADVWAIDVNERALELTRANSQSLSLHSLHVCRAEEVPDEVMFDEIWSNPPIRIGKAQLHSLLEKWLPRLKPGGRAQLVVAKQLGADSLLKWINERCVDLGAAERIATEAGFRVLTFTRSH